MIVLKDPKTNKVLFQFLKHEMPEAFPTHYSAVINEIKYPGSFFGGVFANQVMGVYFQPIEFSGTLKGTVIDGSKYLDVYKRVNQIINLMGKVMKVQIPDSNGALTDIGPGLFILRDFKPTYKMGVEADYSIVFIPHQHQSDINDVKVEKITINGDLLAQKLGGISTKRKATKQGKPSHGSSAGKPADDSRTISDGILGDKMKTDGILPRTGKKR